MKRAEVVFISTPGIGNLVPSIEFAKHLTQTKNQCLSATVLLINFPQRPLVQSYIDSLVAPSSTTTGGPGSIRFLQLPSEDPPGPDEYHATIGLLCLLIDKHKVHVKQALTQIKSSSSVPVAALFVDMFCTSMIDVADELGIPTYLYFASPASFLGFMLHLPALDAEANAEFKDSEGTHFNIPSFLNPVPVDVFPTFMLNRKEDAYFWFLHHAKRYRDTEGIVVNTFQELEPFALKSMLNGGDKIPKVYPIGPLLDHGGPTRWQSDGLAIAIIQDEVVEWLDKQPPSSVVFLSFGSMGSLDGPQLREIADGLVRTGHRFLWSVREPPKARIDLPNDYSDLDEVLPDGFLERTKGKGMVCGWVPQVIILGHKAIGGFVSHCGWNSILESLWYGVPIATWPLYAEQQLNAFQMVKELGLAVEIRLDYRSGSRLVVSAEEVERGVRSLMDGNCVVRRKVEDMSERCKTALMHNGSSSKFLQELIEKLEAVA